MLFLGKITVRTRKLLFLNKITVKTAHARFWERGKGGGGGEGTQKLTRDRNHRTLFEGEMRESAGGGSRKRTDKRIDRSLVSSVYECPGHNDWFDTGWTDTKAPIRGAVFPALGSPIHGRAPRCHYFSIIHWLIWLQINARQLAPALLLSVASAALCPPQLPTAALELSKFQRRIEASI